MCIRDRDQAARAERERRQRRTRQQAAAAQAHEQVVQLADVLEQFLGRGALPRDHVQMCIRDRGYSEKESLSALKTLPEGVGVSDGIKQALKALVR